MHLMCDSTAFLIKQGEKSKLMDNVSSVVVKNGDVELIGLLGERIKVKGRIVKMDYESHEVLIEDVPVMND